MLRITRFTKSIVKAKLFKLCKLRSNRNESALQSALSLFSQMRKIRTMKKCKRIRKYFTDRSDVDLEIERALESLNDAHNSTRESLAELRAKREALKARALASYDKLATRTSLNDALRFIRTR